MGAAGSRRTSRADPNVDNRLCQLLSISSPASIATWDCLGHVQPVCRGVRHAWYDHVVAVDGAIPPSALRRLLRRAPRLRQLTLRSLSSSLSAGSPSLRFLDLRSSSSLTDLRFLHCMPQLRQLLLKDVHDLAPVAALAQLAVLVLSAPRRLDLSPLAHCASLRKLVVAPAGGVIDVEPLRRCAALTTLTIIDAAAVDDFTPIGALAELRVLVLAGVPRLRQYGWIRACRQLRGVVLARAGDCDAAEMVRLPRLRTLVVRRTTVRNLMALRAAPASLTTVVVQPVTGAASEAYYDLRRLRPGLGLRSTPSPIQVECRFGDDDDDAVTLTASD